MNDYDCSLHPEPGIRMCTDHFQERPLLPTFILIDDASVIEPNLGLSLVPITTTRRPHIHVRGFNSTGMVLDGTVANRQLLESDLDE